MRESDGLDDALDQEDGIREAQSRSRRAKVGEDEYADPDERIQSTKKTDQNIDNRLKRYKNGADAEEDLAEEEAEAAEAEEAALAEEEALAAEEAALAAEAAEGAELTLALEEFWWLIFFL
jgi:hypothetical protein